MKYGTGDSIVGNKDVRKARTYYMHPPRGWWYRHHGALRFGCARVDQNEDEWRMYMRAYRDGEETCLDAPMVQIGTLWPSSWSPKGYTRAAETVKWEGLIDPRWMNLQLAWLPAAVYLNLTEDLCLARITDGTRKLELWATGSEEWVRWYYHDCVYGPTEPELELRCYESGSSYTSCRVPVYWGGHPKDTVGDRFDSPLTINIWQHPDIGRGLIVNNAGAVGSNSILGGFNSDNWLNEADVEILGGGWWTEPEGLLISYDYAYEYGYHPVVNGALLMGDRDPTFGRVDDAGAYRILETFTRADNSNLGDSWDVIYQTDNGWNIDNNTARCTSIGYERWKAIPGLRDCAIIGDVKINATDSIFGFLIRLDYRMSLSTSTSTLHGYFGYLSYSDGAATLNISSFDRITPPVGEDPNIVNKVEYLLATEPIAYTLGQTITLTLEAVGDTITLTAEDSGVLGTCVAIDSTHSKPGCFGIGGETPGSGRTVILDNVYAEPRGDIKIRITE
jgi:hypothetical protein